MTKRQRIRAAIVAARKVLFANRTTEMNDLERRYHLSSDGIGGTKQCAMFVGGGDYWTNP